MHNYRPVDLADAATFALAVWAEHCEAFENAGLGRAGPEFELAEIATAFVAARAFPGRVLVRPGGRQ